MCVCVLPGLSANLLSQIRGFGGKVVKQDSFHRRRVYASLNYFHKYSELNQKRGTSRIAECKQLSTEPLPQIFRMNPEPVVSQPTANRLLFTPTLQPYTQWFAWSLLGHTGERS